MKPANNHKIEKCTDNLLMKRLLLIILFSIFANGFLYSQETIDSFSEKSDATKAEKQGLWYGINPSKDYDFFCFADFEDNFLWKTRVRGAHRVIDRFVKMQPADKIKYEKKKKYIKNIYQKDIELFNLSNSIHYRKKLNDPSNVYEIRSFFKKPGYDYIFLSPAHGTILFEGSPKIMSLYVHSRDYPHHLFAVFRKPDYSRVYVSLGKLDFNGWKRISKILPVQVTYQDRSRSKKPMAAFEGLKILSNSHSEDQSIILMFDLMAFMIDKSTMRYPGYEIPDSWGK